MRISHACRTDIGMKRDNNEDNFLELPEQHLFAVFDGMGGHAAGEVASGIAVREMREFYELTGSDPEATWPFKDARDLTYDENRLVTAVKLVNARIMDTSEADASKKNMGSTCVSCQFVERDGKPKAVVAHAGDSRVYLFRGGKLSRITIDHSLVEEYLRQGKITEEEAKNFPQKNIILRALGQVRQLEVEVHQHVRSRATCSCSAPTGSREWWKTTPCSRSSRRRWRRAWKRRRRSCSTPRTRTAASTTRPSSSPATTALEPLGSRALRGD